MKRLALGLLFCASLLPSIGGLTPTVARAQSFEEYTVVEGDTCASIAERYYGSPRRYDRIHAHNPDLGALPHRLRAGMVLRLPLPRESGADATVTDARGSVRTQLPTDESWTGARIGAELRTGSRMSTGERSSAELTFRSSTVAAIRAETLVIVHGGSVERVREEGSHAILREGSLLSRLSELSGGAPLLVETPTAEVEITDGETAVHVQTNGDTGVSTHSGSGTRVRGTGGGATEGASVEVPVGHGTHVRRGGRPSPPRPLPPAPEWAAGERAFLGLLPDDETAGGGTITGSWLPVAAALTYHVEIARREDGRDLVFQVDVPATVTRFEAYGLPPGQYYVRVATLDAELLEGRPLAPGVFEVIGVRLVPPGEALPAETASEGVALLEELDALADAAFLLTSAPPRPSVLVGSRVAVPEGVICAAGTSAPSHELTLLEVGDTYVTCVSPAGTTIVGLELSVVRLVARVLDAAGEPVRILPRTEPTEVRVLLEGRELDRAALEATAEGGEVSAPVVEADGALRTTITPFATASGPVTLAFSLRAAPDVVLGSVEVPVEEPEPVEVAPLEEMHTPALHEGLGLFAMPSWVGLRDEQRTGIGGTLGMTVTSARLGEPDARVRLIAGATAGLFDEYLRIGAVAPLDVIGQAARSADRGARDLYLSLGSRVVSSEDADGVGLAFEVGMWAPTAGALGLDRGRLMIAGDFSFRFLDRLAFRTRQAGIFDLMENGSLLWASAYGFDAWVEGPLSLGLEGTMTIGREDGRDWYAGGVGLGVGLDLRPVVISIAGRYGFGDDLWPTATVAANVRASFE
jgi:hypothetical protein